MIQSVNPATEASRVITLDMGKPITEAEGELDKRTTYNAEGSPRPLSSSM